MFGFSTIKLAAEDAINALDNIFSAAFSILLNALRDTIRFIRTQIVAAIDFIGTILRWSWRQLKKFARAARNLTVKFQKVVYGLLSLVLRLSALAFFLTWWWWVVVDPVYPIDQIDRHDSHWTLVTIKYGLGALMLGFSMFVAKRIWRIVTSAEPSEDSTEAVGWFEGAVNFFLQTVSWLIVITIYLGVIMLKIEYLVPNSQVFVIGERIYYEHVVPRLTDARADADEEPGAGNTNHGIDDVETDESDLETPSAVPPQKPYVMTGLLSGETFEEAVADDAEFNIRLGSKALFWEGLSATVQLTSPATNNEVQTKVRLLSVTSLLSDRTETTRYLLHYSFCTADDVDRFLVEKSFVLETGSAHVLDWSNAIFVGRGCNVYFEYIDEEMEPDIIEDGNYELHIQDERIQFIQ